MIIYQFISDTVNKLDDLAVSQFMSDAANTCKIRITCRISRTPQQWPSINNKPCLFNSLTNAAS